MVRPTIIDFNPPEFKYYPFMITLNICTGIGNVLSPKICVSKETKGINFKAFNMIPIKDEAKAMTEHISCGCKCKLNSTTCNSNQKWNNKTCQRECKSYCKCKEDYNWNPGTCICENAKHLKSISDTSAYSSISNHITIHNYYCLLSLCKTKRYKIKWKIINLEKFVLKILRVIISMT